MKILNLIGISSGHSQSTEILSSHPIQRPSTGLRLDQLLVLFFGAYLSVSSGTLPVTTEAIQVGAFMSFN